jgi:hypothetical protein
VIQDAAATRTADAIFERVDLGSRLAEALPGEQRILLGPVTAEVEEWVTGEIDAFYESDEWQRIWDEVNRAAHATLVAVLTGEGRGAVEVDGGQVTLDLNPLVAEVESRLSERGLDIFDRVTSGEPVNAEIVFLDSPELAKARKAADLLDRFAFVLLLMVVALLIGYFCLRRQNARRSCMRDWRWQYRWQSSSDSSPLVESSISRASIRNRDGR